MGLATSEMKVQNEEPVPEPARISANEEDSQQEVQDLHSYTN